MGCHDDNYPKSVPIFGFWPFKPVGGSSVFSQERFPFLFFFLFHSRIFSFCFSFFLYKLWIINMTLFLLFFLFTTLIPLDSPLFPLTGKNLLISPYFPPLASLNLYL